MSSFPLTLTLAFIATTALAVVLFQRATHQHRITLSILIGWALLQGTISFTGFYLMESGMPPRFVLLVGPPVLLMLFLFLAATGKRYIDGLDASRLTLLHVVRIPVELVLYGLFTYGAIPEVMTFEGRNFDIISGLTAPLVYYFGYVRPWLSRSILIGWNIVCLALLVNVVTHAVLAAPTDFQQIAFDKPNVGVLYFPFVWLPCLVVPLVLFAHLVSLRRLLASRP
ncbi:MAG: hypothetical protein IT229_03100 [Flavobacteriales bacterium]|nr:hypothetical protein [Flavobacteriales bacterium]